MIEMQPASFNKLWKEIQTEFVEQNLILKKKSKNPKNN